MSREKELSKQLDEELVDFRKMLSDGLERKVWRTQLSRSDSDWTTLRFDCVTNGELREDDPDDFIYREMKADLIELIRFGDTQNVKDPLLVSIDGEEKRGQRFRTLDLLTANRYSWFDPKTEEAEHTVFLQIELEFE